MSQENRRNAARQPAGESGEPRQPQRRKRRRSAGSRIAFVLLYVVAVIGVSVLLACVGWIAANDVLALNKPPHEATITISTTDDMDDVADILEKNGLIEYKWVFKLFGAFIHADDKISAGTFTLNTDMDYSALVNGMKANSATRSKVTITIPEGYTLDQIFNMMAAKGVVNDIDDLYQEAANHNYGFDFLQDIPLGEASRLEGFLYPDTYEFYTPHDPRWAINKMLVNFDTRYTEEMHAAAENTGYTLQEILTIASMIEKETDGEDQRNIASVIYNRLKNPSYETAGYLQIDATIHYFTGRLVTQADRTISNPYNTFMYKGLPPGPIANPGLTAIRAALDPATTGYYYYALGDDDKHHFYATQAEFQAFLDSQELYKNN